MYVGCIQLISYHEYVCIGGCGAEYECMCGCVCVYIGAYSAIYIEVWNYFGRRFDIQIPGNENKMKNKNGEIK